MMDILVLSSITHLITF